MENTGEYIKMSWEIRKTKNIKASKKSVLISGLPGIGNVGKLAVDFLIDDLRANKAYEIYSKFGHNSVFVNEKNMVEIPAISIYHKKMKNNDLFMLTGDIQPLEGSSCTSFCNKIIDFCKRNNCGEIITLGGIGLKEFPEKPMLYFAGNNKNILSKYNNKKTLNSITGQIVGASGLLIGLAQEKKIKGISILGETSSDQNYVGAKAAKEIVSALDKKLKLGINNKRLTREMNKLDKTNQEMFIEDEDVAEDFLNQLNQNNFVNEVLDKKDTDYIG